jgi:hypothetical protein
MKIKHYASAWPKRLKIPLTAQEDKFFRFIELSDDFAGSIGDIRRKYGIPVNGFSYRKENEVGLGIPKYLEDEKWDMYLEDEAIIEEQYGITGTWRLSLSYFIKYNYMPKMAEKIEHRAAIFDGDTTLQMLQQEYPAMRRRSVVITLHEQLGKKQLKALIDLQWDQIKTLMTRLPVWDRKKHENIPLYKEISELKDIQHKSWDEIASILGERHPDNDSVHEETYLRNIYYRYTNRLHQKAKRSVSLPDSTNR